jgi:hypothetical protein
MLLRYRHRAGGAAVFWFLRPLMAGACVCTLAACGPDGGPSLSAEQPRGATVAFESIDGPPPAQFKQLVLDLNSQARAHRLAVTSRTQPAAYRVRGYLAAVTDKNVTTVSWVWDVFDQDERRALRIAGTAAAQGLHRGWNAADDAMLQRIAGSSMDRLAAFLTSSAAVPAAPAAAPAQVALAGYHSETPEDAGIFRIFKPRADPEPVAAAPHVAAAPAADVPVMVPLPPSRPPIPAAVSSAPTLVLAASVRR